jgi:hypothetical protein
MKVETIESIKEIKQWQLENDWVLPVTNYNYSIEPTLIVGAIIIPIWIIICCVLTRFH